MRTLLKRHGLLGDTPYNEPPPPRADDFSVARQLS